MDGQTGSYIQLQVMLDRETDMSLSLAEERDRVRRQIEELEQNLGAAPVDLDLLSSDASSGN